MRNRKWGESRWAEGGWRREGEGRGEELACDAAQCSVTEAVMSPMQHAAKVILH